MVILDLNNFPNQTCGDLCRWLIAVKGHHPDERIKFMRGDMQIFTRNFKLSSWAKTAVQESTKGEKMKFVPYRGDFKLKSPTELASGIAVTSNDKPTHQTTH